MSRVDGPDAIDVALQQQVTTIALRSIGPDGFALAGSGAIREHGLTARLSNDVDLFTTMHHAAGFSASVQRLLADLGAGGYTCVVEQEGDTCARLVVSTGERQVEVDLAVDWRANEPVTLDVGPVLNIDDAVANKVLALYGRGEARDYLDVDSIRGTGPHTDDDLLATAAQHDPGFDPERFAAQLDLVRGVRPARVAGYGVSAEEFAQVQARLTSWSRAIRLQKVEPREPERRP